MKRKILRLILIGSIPAILYCGYEVVKIVKDKDVVLSVITGMLFFMQALESLSELMKDE